MEKKTCREKPAAFCVSMCVYERERSGGWGCSVWVERAGERGSFEGGIPLKRAKEASHSEWYSNAISRYKDFVKFALL